MRLFDTLYGTVLFLTSVLLPASLVAQEKAFSERSLSELLDIAYPLEITSPDSALLIYTYVRDRAFNEDSILIAAKAIQYSGFVHMNVGDFEQSVASLKEALPIFEEIDHARGLMGCWNGLANIANFRGEHTAAAESYEKALQYCDDLDTRITITNNIASVLQHTGNARRSIQLLHDLEERFDESVGPLSRAYTYNNIGVGYNSIDQVEEARTYFEKSWVAGEDAGSGRDASLAALNIVATFSRDRDQPYDQTLINESLTKARLILDTLSIPRYEPYYLRLRAEDHFVNKRYSSALSECLESAKLLEKFEEVEERLKVYLLLIDIYKAQNQYDKALHYSEKVKLLNDSLLYDRNNSKVLELEAQYQAAQKDAELANREIIIARQKTTKNYLYGTLALLALLGIFLLTRTRLRQKIKDNLIRLKEEKIENLEKQQKLLALEYMVQGQEEERKRIAKDLHDGLGGILTTARLQLRNIEGEVKKLENLKLFERAEGLLKNASDEVRRIAHDMMPDALVNFGLLDAIQDLADKINSSEKLWINTEFYLGKENIPDREATVIYRIIQEILNNAIKHSDASEVHIEFSATPEEWQLLISDDGVGFDIDSSKDYAGHGINNVKSRVRYLNGELDLRAKQGEGTQYDIRIPKPGT